MGNHPPTNPDIKRQLHEQLATMSPRAFELFSGDLLVYVGLEKVSVTRYIGDGGIDAEGDLIAGSFRLPVAVQVKQYRNNVQRSGIDKFIGALSGRFSQGIFVTTSDFSAGAQRKASGVLPRILTINGAQIVTTMVEHRLGLQLLPGTPQRVLLDEAYFAGFEDQKAFFSKKLAETREGYDPAAAADEQTVEIKPEETLERFAYLGAFAPKPATFDAEAIKSVWLADDPKPTIRALVDRGLLEPSSQGRFWMHAILVKHAQSFLTEDE